MISDNRIKLVNFLEKNLEEKETKIFYNPKLYQNLIIHKDKRILKLITNFKYNNLSEKYLFYFKFINVIIFITINT